MKYINRTDHDITITWYILIDGEQIAQTHTVHPGAIISFTELLSNSEEITNLCINKGLVTDAMLQE